MRKVLKRVGSNLWAYLLCVFVVVIIWNGIFGALTSIPAEEKIVVFIASNDQFLVEADQLQQDLPNGIKSVDVYLKAPSTTYFDAYLTAYGYLQGDILILPESVVQSGRLSEYFSQIPEKYLQEFPHLGLWQENGKIYGLQIHDCESHQSVISSLNYGQAEDEENYYLFFGLKSLHLGDMSNEYSEKNDNGAIIVARRLLSQ